MTDLMIQKKTADEYHDLVDCIQLGHVLDIAEFAEQHPVDNMTTLGQVLLEFFQFHEARMNEHAMMYEALRRILPVLEVSCPESSRPKLDEARKIFRKILPIQLGRRVRHKTNEKKGILQSTFAGSPVVLWDGSQSAVASEWASLEEVQP